MEKEFVAKVWRNKHTGQKAVTVPKEAAIYKGDYVKAKLIEKEVEEDGRTDSEGSEGRD